jgi:ergothioneine biosynthesis protein EgtB
VPTLVRTGTSINPLSAAHCLADKPRGELLERLLAVRHHSLALTREWSAEDQALQSMPDASPIKWHLAHTSWFFEAVVLQAHQTGFAWFDTHYAHLFNSYYEALGPRHPRPSRGLLSRPTLAQVHAYRAHVDRQLQLLAAGAPPHVWEAVAPLLVLGLNHEQQHQELMLTDLLHAFSCNPMLPACVNATSTTLRAVPAAAARWIALPGGVHQIGHEQIGHEQTGPEDSSFSFDNEQPRHRVLLQPFQLASRLVTCGEYAQFMAEGGYQRAQFWLSDGWALVQAQGWQAPAYWQEQATGPVQALHDKQVALEPVASARWHVFGLSGLQPLDNDAPVTHLSFFEAAAYAEWAGARLPTEFEWEAAFNAPGVSQMMGCAWQWTRSSYAPYPGFTPFAGAVGEYNGKFMIGQQVLRGSSLATPSGHSRRTYRNFFPPAARWQFSGVRLAKDIAC